ncbi:hypothetical protein ACG3SL_19585 [Sphingomonas sp. CJ20]
MSVLRFPEGADHAAFKEAMMEAARTRVEKLPALFVEFQNMFREFNPTGLMASAAFYGLQRSMNDQGVMHSMRQQLEQFQVELLQAIMLTIPEADWAASPSTPRATQKIFDTLPSLSDAFMAQRLVSAKDTEDQQERAVEGLQERMRLHTHAVRNWGYFRDVVRIAKELYAPLDEPFLATLGFAATDVIALGATMTSEFERRMSEWSSSFRRVVRQKKIPEMIAAYYKAFPELVGDPEHLLGMIPPEASLQRVLSMLMGHADLRLPAAATFDPADLAAIMEIDVVRVSKALGAISLKPGALIEQKLDYLFLTNPVWHAPAIELPAGFFVPVPQMVMSHIHGILRRLAGDADLLKKLDRARADYLERRLAQVITMALPGANIGAGVPWSHQGTRFETDVIAQIDKVVLIAEAKAHHLSPQGLRGAPDRVRKHVRDLILDPSVQSARLEALIWEAKAGSAEAIETVGQAGISAPGNVELVIRLSVSLDDLSVLSASETELRTVGWIPEYHVLAPMMNIADLEAVADILDQPVLFLHYLRERGPFQRAFNLLGDELDYLGAYLDNGFNLAGLPDGARFALSGMSGPIDHYYEARDAGITVAKPRAKLTAMIRSTIDRLEERRASGWSIAGMHLLAAADHAERARLNRLLEKARKAVHRKKPGMEGGAVVQAIPPLARKAVVTFFVHEIPPGDELRAAVEQVAATSLESSDSREAIVFVRSVERWDEPYQMVCIVRARDTEDESAPKDPLAVENEADNSGAPALYPAGSDDSNSLA